MLESLSTNKKLRVEDPTLTGVNNPIRKYPNAIMKGMKWSKCFFFISKLARVSDSVYNHNNGPYKKMEASLNSKMTVFQFGKGASLRFNKNNEIKFATRISRIPTII
jgi:hypothetical protein